MNKVLVSKITVGLLGSATLLGLLAIPYLSPRLLAYATVLGLSSVVSAILTRAL